MYEYLKMLYKASRLEISDVYILHSYTHPHEQQLKHTHTHAAAVARKLKRAYKIEAFAKQDFRNTECNSAFSMTTL